LQSMTVVVFRLSQHENNRKGQLKISSNQNNSKNIYSDHSDNVLFKGRLHFLQYIKTKRAHFSIKLYELTTSEGITLDILVYCGKGMYYVEDDQYESMATTERIPIIKPAMIKAGRTSRPAVTCCSSTPKDL